LHVKLSVVCLPGSLFADGGARREGDEAYPSKCRADTSDGSPALIIGEEATFPLAQFDQAGVIGAIESVLDSWVSLKRAPAILVQMLGGG
jgi:hypothetical protein